MFIFFLLHACMLGEQSKRHEEKTILPLIEIFKWRQFSLNSFSISFFYFFFSRSFSCSSCTQWLRVCLFCKLLLLPFVLLSLIFSEKHSNQTTRSNVNISPYCQLSISSIEYGTSCQMGIHNEKLPNGLFLFCLMVIHLFCRIYSRVGFIQLTKKNTYTQKHAITIYQAFIFMKCRDSETLEGRGLAVGRVVKNNIRQQTFFVHIYNHLTYLGLGG